MVNLEVCLDSYASTAAVAKAVNQGANRIELCGYLAYGGGLTPSLGLIRRCKTVVDSDRIMCMIRPRSGSFVYTPSEVDTMLQDIAIIKGEGVQGVVFGCLTLDGEIDIPLTTRLCEAAAPMQVTFHRAFDVTPDWRRAFQDLKAVKGVTRILTSGHEETALDGQTELASLIAAAEDASRNGRSIEIIAAAGIDDANIHTLKNSLPTLREVHLTSSAYRLEEDGKSLAAARGVTFGFGDVENFRMDGDGLSRVWDVVRNWK